MPRLSMSLGRRFVQYINRTHGRTGTLWDSRYQSSVTQADTYLLSCQRYLELNPRLCARIERATGLRRETRSRRRARPEDQPAIALQFLYHSPKAFEQVNLPEALSLIKSETRFAKVARVVLVAALPESAENAFRAGRRRSDRQVLGLTRLFIAIKRDAAGGAPYE
ncbi:MAG: hypothetical protein ACKVQT_12610 [Burkholderiales bacterium]